MGDGQKQDIRKEMILPGVGENVKSWNSVSSIGLEIATSIWRAFWQH